MGKFNKTHFHRLQINRAQNFIRENLKRDITLDTMAECSGASRYHFIRVFSAYMGETPFEYIGRLRIIESFKLLFSVDKSVTDIALELGFDSSSSFNKAFKKISGMNPTKFRNLGKAEKGKLIHTLSITKKMEKVKMNLKISQKLEIIERPETKIFSLKTKGGNFDEIAPLVWQDFLGILEKSGQDLSQSEFLGVSLVSEGSESDNHIYKAAVSCPSGKNLNFNDLTEELLPASKYAKFLLKGSYEGIWPAFNFAFKKINESEHEFSQAPCLENHLNDPSLTSESELLTEILIPIK